MLLFSILAIVVALYFHERTKIQLIRNGLTLSNRCLRYSIRKYSALLRGVPNDEDGLQWCKEKNITIHGVEFKNQAHCTIYVDRSVRTLPFPDTRLTDL